MVSQEHLPGEAGYFPPKIKKQAQRLRRAGKPASKETLSVFVLGSWLSWGLGY